MELKLEIKNSKFVVRSTTGDQVVDDVVIKTTNGHSLSLKELLKSLGEL